MAWPKSKQPFEKTPQKVWARFPVDWARIWFSISLIISWTCHHHLKFSMPYVWQLLSLSGEILSHLKNWFKSTPWWEILSFTNKRKEVTQWVRRCEMLHATWCGLLQGPMLKEEMNLEWASWLLHALIVKLGVEELRLRLINNLLAELEMCPTVSKFSLKLTISHWACKRMPTSMLLFL